MFILTDFPRFPETTPVSPGGTVFASTALADMNHHSMGSLLKLLTKADVLLIQDSTRILGFAFLFLILPFLKRPIIAVDLILRVPQTPRQKIIARLKRLLLNRVDHFIHYFQALSGYQKHFGITSERSSYVPFKSNISRNPSVPRLKTEATEEYIYSAGRSLRDFDTLFEALERVKYPAAIPTPNFNQLRRHGARFTWPLDRLPTNVTLLEDHGTPDDWLKNLCQAKVVVIPTLKDSLCASGIGTYLDAMFLGKCVIISEGPGVSDLLRDEVITVPPEDPAALAEAIRSAWENTERRQETASRGERYATALGGEPELMQRLLERTLEWVHEKNGAPLLTPIGHASAPAKDPVRH